MRFFKSIDLFGEPVQLRIFEHSQFHSIYSILLSFLFIVLLFLYTYIFGYDCFFKKNPKTLQSTASINFNEYITFSHELFFAAWRIEDFYGKEVDVSNFLYPVAKYYNYTKGDFENIPYKKCKEFNLSFEISEDISEYYCIDWNNKSFGGTWTNDNKLNYFALSIYFCENGKPFSSDINCSDKEKAIHFLNSKTAIYISVYYPTIHFDPNNKVEPFHKIYLKKYSLLSTSLKRIDRISIQKIVFNDDTNYLLSDKSNSTRYAVSLFETAYSLFDFEHYGIFNISSELYTLNFYMDEEYLFFKRWYMKFSEALAIISTFSKITSMFFFGVNYAINRVVMYDKISGFLFTKETSLQRKDLIKKLNTTKESFINNYLMKSRATQAQSTLSMIKIQKRKIVANKDDIIYPTFYVTKLEKIKSFIGCRKMFKDYKSNKALLEKCYKKINTLLDVCFLLKTYRQIDIIKQCILNKPQQLCLDYSKKFCINEINIKGKKVLEEESKTINDYYNNNKGKCKHIDEVLFSNMKSVLL